MKRLVAAVVAVLFAAVIAAHPSPHPVLGVAVDGDRAASVGEALAFARRLTPLINELPVGKGIQTQQDAYDWTLEMVPYLTYEGVSLAGQLPADIKFFWTSGVRQLHVLGTAYCDSNGPVENVYLNLGYANPASSLYGGEDSLWTLLHELIHMQGGTFCSGASEDLEANTQIATAEVAAAMVNRGNVALLRPLLDELRSMALEYVRAWVSEADYRVVRGEILGTDPMVVARFEKSSRYWAADPAQLQDLLVKYGAVPFESIWTGVQDGGYSRVSVPYLIWNETHYYQVVAYGPLPADDLTYLLTHAEAMAGAVAHGSFNGK